MSPPDAVRQIEAAGGLLGEARRRLADGMAEDMAQLAAAIETCCQGIQALAPAEGQQLKPGLVGLMDELNRLEAELKQQRDRLEEHLASLATRRRAHAAYGRGTKTP